MEPFSLEKLLKSQRIRLLQHALRNQETILIEELWNSPKALIAALAQQATGKHVLLLTGASQEEAKLYHDFAFFSERPVIEFSAWETLPADQIPPSPDVVGDRYRVLKEILSQTQPCIVLSTLQASLQRVISPQYFEKLYLSIKKGETFSLSDFTSKLVEMGYKRQKVAADKGEFALRGGIVDVYPVSSPDPFRIEFWGDEIESIRIFDPIGQTSVRHVDAIDITPAEEVELLKKSGQSDTLLDYLGSNTLVILDDLLALEDRYASLVNMGGSPSSMFSSIHQLLDQMEPLQKIYWTPQPIEELTEIKLLEKQSSSFYSDQPALHKMSFEMFNRTLIAKRWKHAFVQISDFLLIDNPEVENVNSGQQILRSLKKIESGDYELHFICTTEAEELNLQDKIHHAQIKLPRKTSFDSGYLSSGLVVPEIDLILLPNTEITQHFKIRRQKQRSTYHTVQSQFSDLVPGEMVVHRDHGIGRYKGLQRRPDHQGTETEFFQIEYADQAQLYVPIQQSYLLSKYIGATDDIPKFHTLGSSRWKRTWETTERAIMGYAKDLLDLYANRAMKQGFAYPEDTPDIISFSDDFPFIETEDQLHAIDAIKKDMSSTQVMDRLVCGDVGYGKTEVAMRAAFKAVVDGHKQVAVLVPTTVLAMQHYETFKERMVNFPINVAVLSRFNSAKDVRTTIAGAAEGSVDILIGTHRIISGDVSFKDLGLIIIDEEQRFGVRAKEFLKKAKVNVDCLTLSATPIPRTLYMSLVGARDMSVINTPPQDRLPITSFITEPHEQVIKNALLRELARDGQAFYIHNRVETIYGVAERLQKMLPQARIVVGHGQMHADEIDSVFHAFKSGRADILVATTIIENGIDIPNANTILIDNADHFGMADLYQLRGRVGRWNRRAYAYFLVRSLGRLPDISRKRLSALAESSGYGGGMKVAMKDLEIRGAGNILGTEQSGHVAAIGFHLYCKLLNRTVQAYQGKIPTDITDTKMEFQQDARLPEDYVNDVNLRMEFYQRLGEALSLDEVDLIRNELQDRFGPLPEPVEWLYHLARIRVYASLRAFTLLKQQKFSFIAERKQRKGVITKQMLLSKVKSAKDLEDKVLAALRKEFALSD